MKLYNPIIIFDCYIAAESPEEAREALKAWIYDEHMAPTEQTAVEIRDERSIRQSWRDQKPLVAADVSDHDFENHVKGHTVLEVFQYIYQKR